MRTPNTSQGKCSPKVQSEQCWRWIRLMMFNVGKAAINNYNFWGMVHTIHYWVYHILTGVKHDDLRLSPKRPCLSTFRRPACSRLFNVQGKRLRKELTEAGNCYGWWCGWVSRWSCLSSLVPPFKGSLVVNYHEKGNGINKNHPNRNGAVIMGMVYEFGSTMVSADSNCS